MNFTVLKAIFKRDFVSYFLNPTGYVFICVFVVLSALAAFWMPEFFNNNLANLDQLSGWIPAVMLVFVPAITMSTWSEERRQGTDELLLTIPATDTDVVLGKYFAGVAIFTVSLLFSMFAIWLVFSYGLGSPDMGLFLCTYLGYWFLGIAMLAIGMVASFLTKNLTVGFVLGMLFNAPLALFGKADLIVKDPASAQLISRWGADAQLADFQRGVLSLSGVAYFVSVAVVMLYICMVLIGKRHWGTGDDGDSRWGHYFARAVSLLLIVGGLNVLLSNHNSLRQDLSSEQINSLSPATRTLLRELKNNEDVDTIVVDAYISPQVPTAYAAHKLNLLGTLQELESMSGGKIRSNIYQVENFSEEATIAETAFGIVPQEVDSLSRGKISREEIFMGLAVRHKLDKVVVPFIDKGIPVEYELVRSITTVAQESRKRVGIVKTDVELFEGFTMQGMTEESQLVTELKKQYDVVEVDPEQPITDEYDVLLAVQPSAMSPQAMNHLVEAVKKGQPVAVFEDPMPMMWGAPGTSQPRTAGGGGMMGMMGGGQQMPKGDIQQLWQVLGVRMFGDEVILQEYNPYPQFTFFANDFVFIDEGLKALGASKPFNDEVSLSKGMKQVLFLRPGAIRQADDSKLDFKPLAVTGTLTGTIPFRTIERVPVGQIAINQDITGDTYIMAAMIEGEMEKDDDLSLSLDPNAVDEEDEESLKAAKPVVKIPINAVVVADTDCLGNAFFTLRSQGEQTLASFADLDFQNVAFVLNILDYLAKDDRYIEIRKRTRPHRVLTVIDEKTKDSREKVRERIDEFTKEAEEEIAGAQQKFREEIDKIEARTDLTSEQKAILIRRKTISGERKLQNQIAKLEKDRDRKIQQERRQLEKDVRGVQNRYKLFAFILPPILPILLGIFVFFHRRQGEREGVAKTRLRFNQQEESS
ncbi:MAG: Gldg family protein [Aeoliella sp.]